MKLEREKKQWIAARFYVHSQIGRGFTKGTQTQISRPPDKSMYWKIMFFYFSTKTYVLGTQNEPSQ